MLVLVFAQLLGEPSFVPNPDVADELRRAAKPIKVWVNVCVSPHGELDAELANSSGFSDYDRAIIDEIEKWKFRPLDSKPSVGFCSMIEVAP